MALTTESKDLNLSDVIDGIFDGDYQLPEFQRDYVWKDSNIKSLFESVLSSHPIGTVLLLEIEKENPLMAWTSFSEIIPTDNRTLDYEGEDKNPPQYLVLDGQQRLTSLSHLTRGTNNHIWYLDLNGVKQRWEEVEAPSNKEEIKNFIEQELDVFAFIKKKKRTDDPLKDFRSKAKLLPLTLLKDRNTLTKAITDVRDAISEKIHEKNYELKNYEKLTVKESKEELEEIIKEEGKWKTFLAELLPFILDNYFDFKLPTVVVSKKMGISGVCKVFTKINTTGIQLGAFDLLVAVLYPKRISLKQMFDEVISNYPLVDSLDGKPKRYLLQTLALYNKVSPKTSHLPESLKAEMFDEGWNICVKNLNEACEQLDRNCGSALITGSEKYLAYSPLLPIIANVINEHPLDVKDHNLRLMRLDKLRAWYFGAGISSRYGEGSDNKQVKDLAEMKRWFSSPSFKEEMPTWLNNIYGEINTSKSGAVGKTIVSLYNLKRAKDIYIDNLEVCAEVNGCDLHHIFPKAAMRKKIMEENGIRDKSMADKFLKTQHNIDSVLNQTWLLSSTNRDIISDRMPSDYIRELIQKNGGSRNAEQKVRDLFKQHCINDSAFDKLMNDDYFGFIDERKKSVQFELTTTCKIPNFLESEPVDDLLF